MKILSTGLFLLAIVFTSCEKDEIYEPVLEEQNPEEMIKAGGRIGTESLRITRESKIMPFIPAGRNSSVEFNGQLWTNANLYSPPDPSDDHERPIVDGQIWSSSNGKDWILRSVNPFGARIGQSLIVFDDKMWMIGGYDTDRGEDPMLGQIYNTTDGINWIEVNKHDLPIIFIDQAIVFNNKIFVFGGLFNPYSTSSENPVIYSSSNGIDWTLEASDVLDTYDAFASAIVFNDQLYLMNAFSPGNYALGEIWQSEDGRNWNRVRTRPIFAPYPSTGSSYPEQIAHATVVYNGYIWLIGGSAGGERHSEIWFSKDMITWNKYEGDYKFPPVSGLTALNFNNKIWFFGGKTGSSGRNVPFKQLWSIQSNKYPFHLKQ